MFALPSQPGLSGQWFFHHRGGVDKHFHIGLVAAGKTTGNGFQLALDDIVIIAVLGIDGDRAFSCALQLGQRIVLRAVIHRQHDDALGLRPQALRTGAAHRCLGHPRHRSMALIIQKDRQIFSDLVGQMRRADRHGIKAVLLCVLSKIRQDFFHGHQSGPRWV